MRWLGRVTGADGRRCRQTVAATRGQLPLLPTASSDLDSGGLVEGVGALGRWALVHARSQCVTARRGPVTGATSPRTEPFGFLVPQFTTITDLRPHPLPPRGHKHKRRSNAVFFSLSTLLIDLRTNDLLFFLYFDKGVKTLRVQTPSSKGRNKTNSTRHLLPRFHD